MAAIRGKDTKPEMMVRKYLFANGLRFRIHDKHLPGHPDLVFPKYRTVVFVNGCFWHGHEKCRYATIPQTNTEFWEEKISANRTRDARIEVELRNLGWRPITVWTCALRNAEMRTQTLNDLFCSITSSTR